MNDRSLNHTRWNCRYHIVFAPKFRRKPIYGRYRGTIGEILRKLCDHKGIEIVEANACEAYPYARQDSAQARRGADYGIFEREEFPDDMRAVSLLRDTGLVTAISGARVVSSVPWE